MKHRNLLVQELIVEQIPAMRRYARALARDRDKADDLVQDALVRAIKAHHQWQPGTNIRSWLFTILHNVYRLHRRTLARRPTVESIDDPEWRLQALPNQIESVQLAEFARALSLLPEPQRVTMLLVALEGMSYAEAARVTGVPVGTIRSRLCRARKTLVDMLEKHAAMLSGVPEIDVPLIARKWLRGSQPAADAPSQKDRRGWSLPVRFDAAPLKKPQ